MGSSTQKELPMPKSKVPVRAKRSDAPFVAVIAKLLKHDSTGRKVYDPITRAAAAGAWIEATITPCRHRSEFGGWLPNRRFGRGREGSMWQVGVMILIGALAFRSASFITRASQGAEGIRAAVTLRPYAGLSKWYVILGFPLAFVNGYLIEFSWIDCVAVGIGTWLITLFSIMLARSFNSVLQFLIFGAVNVGWLIFNVVRAVIAANQ
jgi:hypothetical protein